MQKYGFHPTEDGVTAKYRSISEEEYEQENEKGNEEQIIRNRAEGNQKGVVSEEKTYEKNEKEDKDEEEDYDDETNYANRTNRKAKTTYKVFTLDHFQSMFSNDSIYWKNFFEKKLGMSISKDSKIKVPTGGSLFFHYFTLHDFVKSIKWFDLLDNAAFLNWFYAKAFYEYREIFQYYSTIESWDSYINKRFRNYQRHEQCIGILEKRFPYTMPVISRKIIGKKLKNLISETTSRVVEELINSIYQLELSGLDKTAEVKNVKDFVNNNFFTALLPKLQPGLELNKFLKSTEKTDSLVEIILKGETLLKEKLNLPSSTQYKIGELLIQFALQNKK